MPGRSSGGGARPGGPQIGPPEAYGAMSRRASPARPGRWLVFLCIWAAAASGCWFGPTPPASAPTPIATEVPATATPSPTPTITPIPAGAPHTLTVWISELAAPIAQPDVRSQIFERQILAFEATHPGLDIQLVYKKPEGKGGLEDYLTTASAVAPGVVPDLLMIDNQYLPRIARKGLIVPLDELLPPELLLDLYPFAIQAGTVDGQMVGIPFETSIEHALYNTAKIAVPPISWTEVFSSGATYLFPTLGRDGQVNDAFLIQYLSTGAELLDSNGEPALDKQALVDILSFYRTGIESGVIPSDVLEYDTVRSGWRKYLQAEVVMTNMTSNLYMEGRGLLKVSQATWIPTRDGQPAVTLCRGTSWAIATSDPNRQALAVKLLVWLTEPANMAAWGEAAELLPTRRAAYEEMPRDDAAYVHFVYNQLEYAIPYPTSDTHKRIYQAMQEAVNAVLRQGEIPAVAAENVLKAVNQESLP